MTEVYTSYYGGLQKGLSYSISLYPPKNWKGGHLKFLAPSKNLFDQKLPPGFYTKVFCSEIASNSSQIDKWLDEIEGQTLTLNCYESPNEFCHRHIVADIIKGKRPDWVVKEIEHVQQGIKAITLHQPWAWLLGRHKFLETRSWSTSHRGKIAIHSAAKNNKEQIKGIEWGYQNLSDLLPNKDFLEFGRVVAIADLVDCIQMTSKFINQQPSTEIRCGDWRPGRFAWKLENIQILETSVPAKGGQGLWNWEPPEELKSLIITPQPKTEQLAIALPVSIPQEPSVIQKVASISLTELTELKKWTEHIKQYMVDSISSYAPGRKEMHLRHFVKLKKASTSGGDEISKIPDYLAQKYQSELVEAIGERLLPGFHQGLVLFYPKGSQIKVHRDSPAYASGAASVNVVGNAKFMISENQRAEDMRSLVLSEGDCIRFDNKQPHAVLPVHEDRWCVCFFYLKKFLDQAFDQLPLFDTKKPDSKDAKVVAPTNPTVSDDILLAEKIRREEIKIVANYQEILDSFANGVQRFTWENNHYGWWNPYGEEVYKIENGKAFLHCLSFGISAKLIPVDPIEVSEKMRHQVIKNGQILSFKKLLIEALSAHQLAA